MVYLHGFQMRLAVQTLFKLHKCRTPLFKCEEALVKEGSVGVPSAPIPSLLCPRTSEGPLEAHFAWFENPWDNFESHLWSQLKSNPD